MFVGDFDGAGPVVGPVQFIDGAATAATAPSGLSYPPADVATKLSFSNNGGASYGYTPTPDAGTGCDPLVTHFKISFNKPADIFAGSNGTNHPTFTLMFRARIK